MTKNQYTITPTNGTSSGPKVPQFPLFIHDLFLACLVYVASGVVEHPEHGHEPVGRPVRSGYVRVRGPDVVNRDANPSGKLGNVCTLEHTSRRNMVSQWIDDAQTKQKRGAKLRSFKHGTRQLPPGNASPCTGT